jgi:hypothetical protein
MPLPEKVESWGGTEAEVIHHTYYKSAGFIGSQVKKRPRDIQKAMKSSKVGGMGERKDADRLSALRIA